MNKTFKNFSIFVLYVFLIGGFGGIFGLAHAADADPGCSVVKEVFEPCKEFGPVDIKRTVCNFTRSTLIDANNNLIGADMDMVMMCQDYITEKIGAINSDYVLPTEYATCHVDAEEKQDFDVICAALSSDVGPVETHKLQGNRSVVVNSINGSLIGIGTLLEGASKKEPIPVNFAYYLNQGVSKIPFAGKALAADSEAYQNLPVIKAVYDIWALTLKVALGLLSLVLLYTGIMITMGKKISTQAVVTVQYAIPKIVIGTVLIIFSYPIGAAITSISFGLYRGAEPILLNLLGLESGGSGLFLLSLMWQMMAMARGGVAYLIIGLFTVLILSIAKIVLYLKVLFIYIKMAFSIITAPLEFVMSTVPGNDDKIKDWFLRMAKYGLTLFGMGIVIPATLYIALNIYAAYRVGGSAEAGGWGVAIALIAPLLVAIFGFSLGMGMEKKVDEMFFGKKKR